MSASLMRRLGRALLCLGVLAGYTLPAQAESAFTQHHLRTHDYYVYQPAGYTPAQSVPLVVYLHGCGEDIRDYPTGTRWNEQAEQGNFIVLYPDQNRLAHLGKCWQWYDPAHTQRGEGEAALIADMTREVMGNWNIDPRRVYVVGFSAGGGMSSVMAVAYPDLYAAFMMFAPGCGYATCASFPGGELAYAQMGPYARPVPGLIMSGTSDPTYAAAQDALGAWLVTNDYADDGQSNGSVPRTAASSHTHPGDLQTYPHTVDHYRDRDGAPLIDFYTVYVATHLYLGGNPRAPFTDPQGPGVTPVSYAWFMAHPMP